MVVGNGRIWSFDENHFVVEHKNDYFAIGTGAQFALGYLDAQPDLSALMKVKGAVIITSKRDRQTGGKVHTQTI